MKDDEIEIPVQIKWKNKSSHQDFRRGYKKKKQSLPEKKQSADKLTGNIVKEIYVPKKIINIVQK